MKYGILFTATAALLAAITGCGFTKRAPVAPDESRRHGIVFFGDTEIESSDPFRTGRVARIVENIFGFEPRAVFHVGDLVDDSEQAEDWELFNRTTEKLRTAYPFYPVLGNHEKGSDWIWYDTWELPNNEEYYSVDIGNLHIVVLNGNKGFLSTDAGNERGRMQYDWLVADLEAAHERGSSIVLAFHHPLYTSGKEHRGDETGIGPILFPLIERYGVRLCVSGHNHGYEHLLVNGTHYVTTGGGGRSLYGRGEPDAASLEYVKAYHHLVAVPSGTSLEVAAYDIGMKEIDSFTIEF